jgi:hypothetical protein
MKVSAVIDCSTSLLASPSIKVVSQLYASILFPADDSSKPLLSIPVDSSPIGHASNALAALCELQTKDIPTTLTARQLYGWLVCLAISRAFEINVGLTIEVPTGPDPRD